jgi:hypothetical protein
LDGLLDGFHFCFSVGHRGTEDTEEKRETGFTELTGWNFKTPDSENFVHSVFVFSALSVFSVAVMFWLWFQVFRAGYSADTRPSDKGRRVNYPPCRNEKSPANTGDCRNFDRSKRGQIIFNQN